MIFVDTNVLIDLRGGGRWRDWSRARLSSGGEDHDLVVNTIVLAELSPAFVSLGELQLWLASVTVEILPLDDDVAFASGQAFRNYRRRHKGRDAILSDFLIGGHARHLNATLLTRDASIYRAYFPDLALITPETDNG